jgi:hypothetical protein
MCDCTCVTGAASAAASLGTRQRQPDALHTAAHIPTHTCSHAQHPDCCAAPRAGHLVSGFVKQQLPILLVNHLTTNPDPRSALVKGFMEVRRGLGPAQCGGGLHSVCVWGGLHGVWHSAGEQGCDV